MQYEQSKQGSETKTFGNFLKVCTNSVSVVNDTQWQHRFRNISQNKSRVIVIVENEGKEEEEKVEVVVKMTKFKEGHLLGEEITKNSELASNLCC